MTDFREIPGSYAVPGSYTEVHDLPAADRLSGMPLRAVVIGQTAKQEQAGQLRENVTIAQVESLYGYGSVLAQTVRTALTENPLLPLDVVGVPLPGDARPATGSIKFTGLASAAATAAVYLAGVRVSWSVTTGDTPQVIAQNLVSAIAGTAGIAATGLTAAVGSSNDTVVITAGEGGRITNDIDLRYSAATVDQIAGIGVTVAGMSGGTGTPDVSPAVLALSSRWYTDVILVQNDTTAVQLLAQEAKRRGGAMVAKDCRVFVGFSGSQGQALQAQQAVNTSENVILFPWYQPKSSSWQMAAALGAQAAESLNTDPARQLRGLTLNTLAGLGPDRSADFTDAQKNVLLQNGCSTVVVNEDGTVTLQRIVTTRTVDPASGTASGVWDVMIPAIGARVRYEWNSYVEGTYFRSKLADDGSPLANSDGVVTPKTLKGSWAAQCKLYEQQGWIDDVASTAPQAVFSRDSSDRNRVNSTLPIKPMGSLMVLANVLNLEV